MVTVRPGHSLPELIVALTLMGATLAGAASTALLGSRWTADAVARQRALGFGEATLDSLARHAEMPGPGEVVDAGTGWVVAWAVDRLDGADAARLRVTVMAGPAGQPLAELVRVWIPPVPGPLP